MSLWKYISSFPSLFCLSVSPWLLLFSGSTYLVPRAFYLLNLPQMEGEKKTIYTQCQWCIELSSAVGDCLEVNSPSFIYQTGFVYVEAEDEREQKTFELKDELRQRQYHVFHTTCSHHLFHFIWSRIILLREMSANVCLRETCCSCDNTSIFFFFFKELKSEKSCFRNCCSCESRKKLKCRFCADIHVLLRTHTYALVKLLIINKMF